MYHGEAVSKEGAVLLEKVDCLWTFLTHVSNVSILVALWHPDQFNVKKRL